jgi:hypothetical protein
MLFVDGENLTIRAQELAKQRGFQLNPGRYYLANVFIWLPNVGARKSMMPNAPLQLQPTAIRAHYYSSVAGDEPLILSVRESLWQLGFQPQVFKKEKQGLKSKGVDIALAKDFISNAFLNNYDVAVLMAGDADYVPMIDEVKRLGKVVYVSFFYSSGLNPLLRLASDECFQLDDFFTKQWVEHGDKDKLPPG